MTNYREIGSDELERRQADLLALLESYGAVVVAFSGGVDSTYLAWAAHRALGDDATAVLAASPSLPARERAQASEIAAHIGIRLAVIETKEFDDERYLKNDGDRCYWCRKALVQGLEQWLGDRDQTLIYGAIPDDLGDDRPGMRAAEAGGLRAPLIEVGLDKRGVRELSRRAGLPMWDKAASACLASRVPVGHRVTAAKLARIESAEEVLHEQGFRVARVRDHEELARIELAQEEIPRLADARLREQIVAGVRRAGYERVTVDLAGYRPAGLGPLPVADPSSSREEG